MRQCVPADQHFAQHSLALSLSFSLSCCVSDPNPSVTLSPSLSLYPFTPLAPPVIPSHRNRNRHPVRLPSTPSSPLSTGVPSISFRVHTPFLFINTTLPNIHPSISPSVRIVERYLSRSISSFDSSSDNHTRFPGCSSRLVLLLVTHTHTPASP